MTLLPNCYLKERGLKQKKENQFQALVQKAMKKALKWVALTDIQGLEERKEKDPSGKVRVGCQATGKNTCKNILLKCRVYLVED